MSTGQPPTQGLCLQFRQRAASSIACSARIAQRHLVEIARCALPASCVGHGILFQAHVWHLGSHLLEQIAGFFVLMALEVLIHARRAPWLRRNLPDGRRNPGPSTQANFVSPPTVSRQPPHMPVPSIMMGFMRDDGLDAVFLCQLADELHHDQRADGDDFVILLAARPAGSSARWSQGPFRRSCRRRS